MENGNNETVSIEAKPPQHPDAQHCKNPNNNTVESLKPARSLVIEKIPNGECCFMFKFDGLSVLQLNGYIHLLYGCSFVVQSD